MAGQWIIKSSQQLSINLEMFFGVSVIFQLPGHGCDRNSYLKDHQIETYLIVPGDTYRQVSVSTLQRPVRQAQVFSCVR